MVWDLVARTQELRGICLYLCMALLSLVFMAQGLLLPATVSLMVPAFPHSPNQCEVTASGTQSLLSSLSITLTAYHYIWPVLYRKSNQMI